MINKIIDLASDPDIQREIDDLFCSASAVMALVVLLIFLEGL